MTFTIFSHYYNNPLSLEAMLRSYAAMAAEAPGRFEFVLVDDHSPQRPPVDSFAAVPGLRVFRLRDDVPWNMPAARNIGFHEAQGDKVFVSDIDHVLGADQLPPFLQGIEALEPGQKAHFPRIRPMPDGTQQGLKPHLNMFAIHRADYWRVGGYEERFSGHYGQEDKYFAGCCRKAGIEEIIIGAEFEVAIGTATPGLDRDKSVNEAILAEIMATRTFTASRVLQYPYDQIY